MDGTYDSSHLFPPFLFCTVVTVFEKQILQQLSADFVYMQSRDVCPTGTHQNFP